MYIAYTNLRVGHLEKSIAFYQDVLGMTLHRKVDNEEYKYSLAWLGFTEAGKDTNAGIELTYNWDTDHYDLGAGFGQIVIAVEDVYKACDAVKAKGWTLTREAGPVKGGNSVIAFMEDPDGYRIEFVEIYKPGNEF